jgi:hypothetical protein
MREDRSDAKVGGASNRNQIAEDMAVLRCLGSFFPQKKGTPMALSRCVMSGRRSCVAEQYRRFAQACLELARNAQDERARASLLHMAQVWCRLAEERVNEADERQSAES